ncbi:MAG: formylglycine-generating enzyme family protein [Myxococcota bacterium]
MALIGLCGFGVSCLSETNAPVEGLQCGEGTVAADGYCVPIDASVDNGTGGAAGVGGTGGIAGEGGGGTAGGTGGSLPEDAGDAQETSVDAAEDAPEAAVSCTGTCGTPGCGACPTIPVVSAQMPNGDAYGIDAYETTVAEYQVFLDAKVPKQTDEACEWNETYEPNPLVFEFPSPDMPIHAVDWCDARAYCEWAGKRLCKGSESHLEDPEKSEWYNACTLGGIQDYPYGDSYDPEPCPPFSAPYSPGSLDTCEGGYPGLFDMAGNLSEWTDECQQDQPGYATMCARRGAGYGGSTTWFGCRGSVESRQVERANAGIRCCVDQ